MRRRVTLALLVLLMAFGLSSTNAFAWRALKIDAVRAANGAQHAQCGAGWLHTCVDWAAPKADSSDGGYCAPAGYHSWYCYMGFIERNRLTGSWRYVNTMAHVFHLGVVHFYRNGKAVY